MWAEIATLVHGHLVWFSENDLPIFENHSWHIRKCRTKSYLWTNKKHVNGGWYGVSFHRLVLNPPSHLQVDHIDSNGLNNCRANLRVCTASQNMKARMKKPNTSSRFKGVTLRSDRKKWGATIGVSGKCIWLGSFETEEMASDAYDKAAIRIHGEYARLNNKRSPR